MNYTATRINRFVAENRFDDLISFSEQRHQLQFEMLLQEIQAANAGDHGSRGNVVMVAGPSSSGKTTFSNVLAGYLKDSGYRIRVISVDDFYLNRAEIQRRQLAAGRIPRYEDDFDYETLDAFDIPFFQKQMNDFLAGREIVLPYYNFTTGMRETGEKLSPDAKDFLILEGIPTLNPALTAGVQFRHKFRVYICPFDSYVPEEGDETHLILPRQIRFMRRAIRDSVYRGSPLSATMGMWPGVRNGEEQYIKPVKKYADFFFNSSLEYEIAFLKEKIEPLYQALSAEDKERFNAILPHENLAYYTGKKDFTIPENSIFREFFLN